MTPVSWFFALGVIISLGIVAAFISILYNVIMRLEERVYILEHRAKTAATNIKILDARTQSLKGPIIEKRSGDIVPEPMRSGYEDLPDVKVDKDGKLRFI